MGNVVARHSSKQKKGAQHPTSRKALYGSDSKQSAWNAGDPGSIPGLGRSSGEGNGNHLWYTWLEDSMGRGAWWATVNGSQRVQHDWVTKHQSTSCFYTQLATKGTPEFRMEKILLKYSMLWILALDSWDAYLSNNVNKPRFLHLSHIKKSTKIINLRCLFFVNSINLFMPNYSFFFSPEKKKKLYLTWAIPYLSGVVPQGYLRGYLWDMILSMISK